MIRYGSVLVEMRSMGGSPAVALRAASTSGPYLGPRPTKPRPSGAVLDDVNSTGKRRRSIQDALRTNTKANRMPDLERYNQASSTWTFSWGLRTEKRARNGSESWITFSAKKEKTKRAHLQLSDGVSDLSRNSRVVGIEY